MKRLHLWLGFVALVTLLLLVACSPSTVQPTAGQAASAAPTTAPTPRPSDGETPIVKTIASRADVSRITVQELKAKLDAGQAVVIDARRQTSYTQRHIAGAISLPEDEVAARLAELPSDKLAVFYCT